ncbi:MAG: FAD-dependent oxidoreductase [Bacillota bacterium]
MSVLFKPFEHPKLALKNRIVMAPMGTNLGTGDGAPTEATLAYYAERAVGGCALVIVEAAFVADSGRHRTRQLGVEHDGRIEGLSAVADAIKARGARAAIQLSHAGRQTSSRITGVPTVGPSSVALGEYEIPRELRRREIRLIAEQFGAAAARARKAGFDAVEIHGAHGYLLASFLSPFFNKRADEYGGTLENRMRFPLEVVREVRRAVGSEYPIIYRLSADEFLPGGLSSTEACYFARELVREGVDILHVSAGAGSRDFPASIGTAIAPYLLPRGHLVDLAGMVKAASGAPVIAVGRLNRREIAENALQDGKADLIALGRALIAEPDWPSFAADDSQRRGRPCLSCNECHAALRSEQTIGCTVNPRVGREHLYPRPPARAAQAKRVLVIGGGPAGLECARVAAERGHTVTLLERSHQLGGQLLLAKVPPGKQDIAQYLEYLVCSVTAAGVRIVLGVEATAEIVREHSPDVLVVATGAEPLIPPIPGVESGTTCTAWEVLGGKLTGHKVIVVGGGYVGLETAHYLAMRGKEVMVIEMLPEVGRDVEAFTRAHLLRELKERGVSVVVGQQVVSVGTGFVETRTAAGLQRYAGDTVVLATGSRSRRLALTDEGAVGRVGSVFVIGDAREPRKIKDAVREGFEVGHEI